MYIQENLGNRGLPVQQPNLTIHYLKFIFINRDEKSQKKPRKMDQSFINEAEHNNLLKILEKNLQIPPECTYADQKAVDAEVSSSNEAVLQEISSL